MIPISPATRLVALLGDPVHHSRSPSIQNAAFRAAGLDAVYVVLRCSAADAPALLQGIARAGGAGNVTIPHKEVAARALDHPSDAVLRTGACNTFWLEGGRVCGDNTDVEGFRRAVRTVLPNPLSGGRVLLLGAGGAARAVIVALLEERVGRIDLVNRSPERASALHDRFGQAGVAIRLHETPEPLRGEAFDLVVNATSLGLHASDAPPLPPDLPIRPRAALDLVYAPAETPWVRSLRERGIPAADGLEMLLEQGAAAFERWWGQPAPKDAMRAAIRSRE